MADYQRDGLSYKEVENRPQEVVIDAQEADADIGYFELKLEEFKGFFNSNYIQNRLSNMRDEKSPREDFDRVTTMIKIYEFILGKNKDMLKAINKERTRNDDYKKQLPILIERLQHLSEACIKKEELIKTQGEYMQQSEGQIYELQIEVQQKEVLIRELNSTISDQREYLDSKYTNDNSQFMNSFDSRIDGSYVKNKSKHKDGSADQEREDAETIESLNQDIVQLLKDYKTLEKQKDYFESRFDEASQKNEDFSKELLNMDKIIEDQDTTIQNMREEMRSQFKDLKVSQAYGKQLNMIQNQLGANLDETENDLNKSANISQQINLENFKAGRIGARDIKTGKTKVDKKALEDVLNLSYQLINIEGDRKEQSMIEDRMTMRMQRGISPFGFNKNKSTLIPKSKEGNKTDSTAAEGESKGIGSRQFHGLKRMDSTGILQ